MLAKLAYASIKHRVSIPVRRVLPYSIYLLIVQLVLSIFFFNMNVIYTQVGENAREIIETFDINKNLRSWSSVLSTSLTDCEITVIGHF